MKLIKRILAGVCALAILVISFPVTVRAEVASTAGGITSVAEWVTKLSTSPGLSIEYGVEGSGNNTKQNGIVLVNKSSATGTVLESYTFKCDGSNKLGFYSGISLSNSYQWSTIKNAPNILYQLAKFISDCDESKISNLDAVCLYAEGEAPEKVDKRAAFRDYLLRAFFQSVGDPRTIKDANKAEAVSQLIYGFQVSGAASPTVTSLLTENNSVFANCTTLADVAKLYANKAANLGGVSKSDDQKVDVAINEKNAYEAAIRVVYLVFSNTSDTTSSLDVDATYQTIFGVSQSDFAFAKDATNATALVNDIIESKLSTFTRDRALLASRVVVAAVTDNLPATFTITQKYEIASIPFTRGINLSLAENSSTWDRARALKRNSTKSVEDRKSRYDGPIKDLSARVELLKKAEAPDLDKLRKTLGNRIKISWALSGAEYTASTVDTKAGLSDVFAYSVPTALVEGAYMPPHPNDSGALSYLMEDSSPLYFENYMELKNEMSEVYALSQSIRSSLNVTRLQTTQATAEELNMFQYLDDIRDSIAFMESNKDWGSSRLLSEFNNLWTGKPSTGDQKDLSLKDIYDALESRLTLPDLADFIAAADSQPLRNFFNLETSQINDQLISGICLSSTFIPFKTNVYNVETYRPLSDDDEFTKFHSRWGYNRKALYIDTNVNSVTEFYNTRGNMGTKRLCLLKDLLEPEKEIQLYADDNFYNAGDLKAYQEAELGRLDYTDKSDSTKNAFEQFWDKVGNFFKFNILDVLKTAEKDQYATQLSNVKQYGLTKQSGWKADSEKEIAVLGGNDIDSYTSDTDNEGNSSYNVMQAMAFTSAVYRFQKLFNLCATTGVQPVFQSSKNVAYISGASSELKDSFFNYTLLRNIQNSQNINFTSNLDKDRPVYLDVYGNILTESGYVVIPAAANATLYSTYNAKTAAFLTTYGKEYFMPSDLKFVSDSAAASMFEQNDDKTWKLVAKAIGEVDYNRLDTSSDSVKEDLMTLTKEFLDSKQLKFNNYIRNIFLEVMRGAPLERIDKIKEGLNPNARISKAGIVQAVKLDALKTALNSSSQNAVLAIPNLAYVQGLEYVVLFIYKISILICVVMLLFQIFLKAMQGRFGVQAVLSMFLTIALTLGAMFVIPKVFDISYYAANRALLQGEAETVSMLNLEKQESGMEIGMTEVRAPDISTSLLLKMKDVDIPWYDAFFQIASSSISKSMEGIYKSYADTDPAMHEEQFEFRAGSLYVPVEDLYQSTTVLLDPRINALSMSTQEEVPASFYTPYYVFLQTLVTNVNQYNIDQNVYTYSTATYSGGKKKSLGLIQNYLTSDEFIDPEQSSDILKLNVIYQTANGLNVGTVFSTSDIDVMHQSIWYNDGVTGNALNTRIEKLDASARKFVADNRELIGKVSDETFLKVMSLHLAIEYNKLFSVGSADALELYNLSQDDLTRISIAPKQDVIEGSSLSFSRFVYLYGGEPAIYAAGLLSVVNFISDWVKPLATLLILIAVFISLFVYKIILGNKSDSMKGYVMLVVALMATNVLYALILKATLFLPSLGLPPTVCMLVQIFLQFILMAVFAYLASVVLLNWRDLGSTKFTSLGFEIKQDFAKSRIMNMLQENMKRSKDSDSKGWRVYKAMKDADQVRKYKAIDRKEGK